MPLTLKISLFGSRWRKGKKEGNDSKYIHANGRVFMRKKKRNSGMRELDSLEKEEGGGALFPNSNFLPRPTT